MSVIDKSRSWFFVVDGLLFNYLGWIIIEIDSCFDGRGERDIIEECCCWSEVWKKETTAICYAIWMSNLLAEHYESKVGTHS